MKIRNELNHINMNFKYALLIVLMFVINFCIAQDARFITREYAGREYRKAISKKYTDYPVKIKLTFYNPDNLSFPFLIQEEIKNISSNTYFEIEGRDTDNESRIFSKKLEFWSFAEENRTVEMNYYIFHLKEDSAAGQKFDIKGDLLLFDEFRRYPHASLPIGNWEDINGVKLIPFAKQ
jgi:hypothetical protein